MQALERDLLAMLRRSGLSDLSHVKILEVGCGTGQWMMECVKWGARPENIAGMDLLPARIAEAQRRCPAAMQLWCGSATHLDTPDGTFDLVLQLTVFSSILDVEMRRQVASEMCRVLKPGGHILWYDLRMDNPTNPDVRGISTREILQLFPGCQIFSRRATLAPPLSRILAPRLRWLCHGVEWLKIFNTHALGLIRKPEDG